MATLAREGKKVLMVAVFAFHPCKAVAQIAAVKIPVHDLSEIEPEESIGPFKSLFVLLEVGFQMILDATVIIACSRSPGPIDGCLGGARVERS